MKKTASKIYSIILLLLFIVGILVLTIVFAAKKGNTILIGAVVGFALSLFFAPFFHEMGHLIFASSQKMRLTYVKIAFFRIYERSGKLHFSFCSLFAPEETQVIPMSSGNMKKRMSLYTIGGLILGGLYLIVLVILSIVFMQFSMFVGCMFLCGIPYAAYLFLLNVVPAIYAGGKTDMLIYHGIKKDLDEERALIGVMEIYGELSEGKTFSKIDSERFNFPIVCEDIKISAVIADLKYRREIELGEYISGAKILNRLTVSAQSYFPELTEEIAAELAYMNALVGNIERSEQCLTLAQNYLNREMPESGRIMSAISLKKGEIEKAKEWKEKGLLWLKNERIEGKKKSEELLLLRE